MILVWLICWALNSCPVTMGWMVGLFFCAIVDLNKNP